MASPGYLALHEGAAWLDVSSSRARIIARGEDRVRLLHALATNVVEGLSDGAGVETFFLNPQGRIQVAARIYIAADHVLLECDAPFRERLLQYLESYIIMDDVALEDVTNSTAAIALEGPKSEQVLREACILDSFPDASHGHTTSGDVRVFLSWLSGQTGCWLMTEPGRCGELIHRLESAGAVAGGADDFEVMRVENRIPRLGVDYTEKNIPHETQQLQLVSFTKGCYVGQEIVERVRSQGQVNRLLVPLELDGAATGDDRQVRYDGREVGELTSVVVSPSDGHVRAFGMLRREAAVPGSAIEVGGTSGRVIAWT